MEKIWFGIGDYDEKCIKLYFSKSHILLLDNLEEFDDLILKLQNMRKELVENWESQ